MANIIHKITDKIRWLQGKDGLNIPNDLEVIRTELQFNDRNELDYLLFQVTEREGGKEYAGYRAVRLLQLRYISLEARRDAGLLQKMRTVLRGLYGAQVDLVYLAAGIFKNPKLGVVQCYGVSAFSKSKEEAISRSLYNLSAIRAGLVGAYRQIRLDPLSTEVAQWLARSLEQMPFAIVAVGHPDPRENARGGDSSLRDPLTSANQGAQQYSLQQNEMLFRGMSSLEEEFLLMLLASHVRLEDITRDVVRFARRNLSIRLAPVGDTGSFIRRQPAGDPDRRSGRKRLKQLRHEPFVWGHPGPSRHGWSSQLPRPGAYRWTCQHERLGAHGWSFRDGRDRRHPQLPAQQSATGPLTPKEMP